MDATDQLQKTLGHKFADEGLLHRALRHASLNVEADNEAFEFLGDRVLGLAISQILVSRHAEEKEGALARRLNQLVSGKTCAQIARQWNLAAVLKTDAGIKKRDDVPDAILADACEAILGAVFLDAGFDVAAKLIEHHWNDILAAQAEVPVDSKSALQELLAKQNHDLPVYEIVEQVGPAHAPVFVIEVKTALGLARGQGGARKLAEQNAASALLQLILEESD